MGTRADFYVGKGAQAEWLGSIAWDGYRDGIDAQVLHCTSEAAYRHAVNAFIESRDDGIKPKDGWPWPWDNSRTTDCSYWFFDEQTWDAHADFRGRDDNYRNLPYRFAPCNQPAFNDEHDEYGAFMAGLDEITEWPDFTGQFNGGSAGFIMVTA